MYCRFLCCRDPPKLQTFNVNSGNSVNSGRIWMGFSKKGLIFEKNSHLRLCKHRCPYETSLRENIQLVRYRFIASFSFRLTEVVRVKHLVDTDLYTCQHGLTRFTCFHGTHRKSYFCVRCSHTLCPLTCTNIESHHTLYLTS